MRNRLDTGRSRRGACLAGWRRVAAQIVLFVGLLASGMSCCAAQTGRRAVDRPWISTTYFYWYGWDYQQQWGSWAGQGVYNTPLRGYYDSARYDDNLFGLRQTAEWGLTDQFMDYWGPGWQGENGQPREDVLMRAAEDLRKRGYNIHMSFYQDGTDFDMARFSRNLDPGRDTRFYVERFAKSPALPTLNGKPLYLIYGRNGAPKLTATDAGFREWLERKYRTIGALNARWGAAHRAFADLHLDLSGRGPSRADSIKYQYAVWQEEMERANAAARPFGLPGVLFSWDIGYTPFLNYGFSDQTRVFTGPHSYGGIFDVPHALDTERFIQAAVAKRYNTLFLDTFKNYYHDWEIRIPGICYPADFCAFDRFWVQSLAHYSEGLVHLSWNEWWEGSNMEPSYEYGKTYCEKNLLYSTLMQQCFPGIQQWNRGAKVAVLLNDWHWLAGGRHPEEIYACIQALRRNNIRFDLLPDDFVTAGELSRFTVVVAPAAGIGFGRNAADQRIADLLLAWAGGDRKRWLIISDYAGLAGALGLKPAAKRAGRPAAGPDMNLFVDVGEPGDDRFLVDGCSNREDWGRLAPGSYGASATRFTARWTPAVGSTTSFMLPFSAHREHVLRLRGDAMWANHVTVLVDGNRAAEFDIRPGRNVYEVKLPAAALEGRQFGELTLQYARANVPTERDPARFPSENRVCNLAIDWLQLATAGRPFSRTQAYRMPRAGVGFAAAAPGALARKTLQGQYVKHALLTPAGTVLSRYLADGSPRDLAVGRGRNILYVNGLLSALPDERYLDTLLRRWAGCVPEIAVHGKDILLTPLQAGDTDILLAYNYAAPARRACPLSLPVRQGAPPVVEVRALSQDGSVPARPDLAFASTSGRITGNTPIRYYGVYQIARGYAALKTPELALAPGQSQAFTLQLTGLRAVSGRVRLITYCPTLTAETAAFRVAPGAPARVPLTITAAPDIDWGVRTVVFDVEVNGRHTCFWRSLRILRLPDLQVVTSPQQEGRAVSDGAAPVLSIADMPLRWAKDATARHIRLRYQGVTLPVGEVAPGKPVRVALPAAARPDRAALDTSEGILDYQVGETPHTSKVTVHVAGYPDSFPRARDALTPVIVANPHDEYLENVVVSVDMGAFSGKATYIRDSRGVAMPSQVSGRALYWLAMLPPKSATTYYLCGGTPPKFETDLRVTQSGRAVTVRNAQVTLGWSGKAGGTLTTFRSAATGLDYAAGTCGGGVGSWGRYDPHKPAISTVDFVSQERKLWQRDLPEGEVKIVERGPVYAVIEVTAQSPGSARWTEFRHLYHEFHQQYVVFAGQAGFRVYSEVQCSRPVAEVVALDFRFNRNNLWKLFPNFIGSPEGLTGSSPSAGWREAGYIPPCTTLMAVPAFQESITLLPGTTFQTPPAPNWYRNGLWPEKRPVAGPVKYAEVEYIRKNQALAAGDVWVRLHPGTQTASAAIRRMEMDARPAVIVPKTFTWHGDLPAPAEPPAGWWNPCWRYAVPVTVGPLPDGGAGPIVLKPDFAALTGSGETFDPASPRAVLTGPEGLRELPTASNPETGEVIITFPAASPMKPAPAQRTFTLYFDTLANGPKRAVTPPGGARSSRLANGGFEKDAAGWVLDGATVAATDAHAGAACMKLEIPAGVGPVVITNKTLQVSPNSQYRVSWWARSATPGATVATNFNQGPQYDFGQVHIPLIADGRWHRYEAVVPVGSFPPGVNPDLRLWILGRPQTVYLDDVDAQPVSASAAPGYSILYGQAARW